MKHKSRICILLVMLLSIVAVTTPATAFPGQAKINTTGPIPFMHRPYYGNQTISQRTTSFFDHDKPWYVNDGNFVRRDGKKWTKVSIGSCTGGVNCYDGHNGYDLNLWFESVLSAAGVTVLCTEWCTSSKHHGGLWMR